MSSLIPESPLTFSPQLAATIGLEEAILLPILNNAALLQSQPPFNIIVSGLGKKMPFWSLGDIQRVLKSLSDKGIILVLSPPITQTDVLSFQFELEKQQPQQKSSMTTSVSTKIVPAEMDNRQKGANRISATWQPSPTVMAQLAQLNIPATFTQQQVANFVLYWRDRDDISHSWSAKFHKYVAQEWQRSRSELHFVQSNDQPTAMQREWQPSADALEILQRNAGINLSFIEDAIPEFVLFWRDKGSATATWNSKFIQHVKRQWAKYTSALKYDTEPRRISSDWQPNQDVFDILTMANIDAQFAQNCLAPFVLYWQDTNQLHSSWNTKFLQHVKYCWSHQHELQRLTHEGQQNASGANTSAVSSFVAKHTDRSWANGL